MTPLHLVSQARLSLFDNDPQITKTAQLLLEHGASVHVRNKYGRMPLHTASRHVLTGIVVLLLKFGADVDAQDNDAMTPLLLLSQSQLPVCGDNSKITKTAQVLLEHGASVHVRNKNSQTALHLASHHGHCGGVALLLEFGADVDAQDNDAMTPLLSVLQFRGGDDSKITKTARVLLEHGASVHLRNKNCQTPLHLASHDGHCGRVALLLKFGAGVDAQDNDATTPLLSVLQFRGGDDSKITKTAQVLLEHGASVHLRNKNGQTPLHLASQRILSGIVEFLLKLGADVDARDNSNITPLHLAISSPFQRRLSKSSLDNSPLLWSVITTIKLLLENGVNLQMQNDKGETPFQVALTRGEQEIIHVLSGYVQNDQAMSK